jgi:predicted secreted protein
MFHPRDKLKCAAVAALIVAAASASQAQENKVNLFKVVTIKDEIVIGLSDDEMKALGGPDAGAVARALAQKGDMMVWQYNVHRGPNGDIQQAPTARIGLLANASLRVEPYTTPYAIVPHQ